MKGFTLIEVILSIVLLVTLSLAALDVIRNTLNIKSSLGESVAVHQQVNTVMSKISMDLEHTFIIHTRKEGYNATERSTKTIFDRRTDGSLRMTTMVRHPRVKDAHESDQTLVVYELKSDEDRSGQKILWRGESKVIPEDLGADIPMVILMNGVKDFKVSLWDGNRWLDSRWNTNRSEFRNKLPHMVRVELEVFSIPPENQEGKDASELPTTKSVTLVHLPRAWGLKEHRPYSGSLKW